MSKPLLRARRRRVGTAAAAFSHAFALTGSKAEAESIAATALRRGAHSRTAVLAHARHLTSQSSSAALSTQSVLASSDLRILAGQLSSTRSLQEQALVDLELRYGLDHGSFSRVLGVSASRARQRSEEVAKAWAENLDPAMLASLGAGTCEELQTILSTTTSTPLSSDASDVLAATGTETGNAAISSQESSPGLSVASLVELAPAVSAHSKVCEKCEQRLKVLTPVRSLVGQTAPEDVPSSVSAAAKSARRRLPMALPPSIDANRIDARRLRVVAYVAALILVVFGCVYGLFNHFTSPSDSASQDERVARLVGAAPATSLSASPALVNDDGESVQVTNNSRVPISWNATTNVPWLTVEPFSGQLRSNQSISAKVKATSSGSAIITFAGSDGSKQIVRYEN